MKIKVLKKQQKTNLEHHHHNIQGTYISQEKKHKSISPAEWHYTQNVKTECS